MLWPTLELAFRSRARRQLLLQLAGFKLLALGAAAMIAAWSASRHGEFGLVAWLGWTLLACGVADGGALLGWRLAQLPKTQALEALLLAPAPPWRTMLAEQAASAVFVLLSSAAAWPVLALLCGAGWLDPADAAAVSALGAAFAFVLGFGLAWWSYEPRSVRRWGEGIAFAGTAAFVVFFGVLGNRSLAALNALPFDVGAWIRRIVLGSHYWNPFTLVHRLALRRADAGAEVLLALAAAAAFALFAALRMAARLKAHYLERNYRVRGNPREKRPGIGAWPVTWWAVRRVNEYPGRANLYFAGGAALLYAAYLFVGEAHWPSAFGKQLFEVYDLLGGVPGMATGLALLAAVPAAYQYGLWDSSIPARAKRLENLLPTRLDVRDYLHAAARSSWNRGRGYLLASALLLIAGFSARRYGLAELLAAAAAALALLALHFAVGFRYFSRTRTGASLGFALTAGIPALAWGLGAQGFGGLARLTPPGAVYYATNAAIPLPERFAPSLLYAGLAALLLADAWRRFDGELRTWYDQCHGAAPA